MFALMVFMAMLYKHMVFSQQNVHTKVKTCDITFQVMNGKKDLDLLGRADIAQLGLVIRVNAAETKMLCQIIMNKHKDVLGSSIGCMPGEYEIKIDDTVTPVVHPSHF